MSTGLKEDISTVNEPLRIARSRGFELLDSSIAAGTPLDAHFGLRLKSMGSGEFYQCCPVFSRNGQETGGQLKHVKAKSGKK